MSTPTRRTTSRRVLSVILSILNAGAGHVALGYPVRGISWFIASLCAVVLLALATLMNLPYLFWMLVAIVVAIRLASLVVTFRSPIVESPHGMGKLVLLVVLVIAIGESGAYVGLQLMPSFRGSVDSMYPTIQNGDRFYSSRISPKLGRGDIVTFDYPMDRSKLFIKRIVGIAGDKVQMIDGQLILNGVPIKRERTDEPCVVTSRCKVWRETLDGKSYRVVRLFETGGNSPDFGPATIARGYLFVLGDNRDDSLDSRYWGALPVDLVKGNPLFVYWSSNESGIHWNRINQLIN